MNWIKPEALGESPSTCEISQWMKKESEYQCITFLKGKDDVGEIVRVSECSSFLQGVQSRLVKQMLDMGLIIKKGCDK